MSLLSAHGYFAPQASRTRFIERADEWRRVLAGQREHEYKKLLELQQVIGLLEIFFFVPVFLTQGHRRRLLTARR